MRRFIAVIASVVLVMAMMVPAFAAELLPYNDYKIPFLASGISGPLTKGFGPYDGILWLSDTYTLKDVSVKVSYVGDVYTAIYTVVCTEPFSAEDDWKPLFALCMPVPLVYDVMVDNPATPGGYTPYYVPAGNQTTLSPAGLTAYRTDDTPYTVVADGPYTCYIAPSLSSTPIPTDTVNIMVKISPKQYDSVVPPDVDDVDGVLNFPFTEDIKVAFGYLSQLSQSPVAQPIVYGAVFLMIGAMVCKFMM